jgi:hypothetical protein
MRGLEIGAMMLLVISCTTLAAQQPPTSEVGREQAPYGAMAAEVEEAKAAGCVGPQTELNLCAWNEYRQSQKRLDIFLGQIAASLHGSTAPAAT